MIDMSFRFRRSIKLTKGVRLNVSKRGVGLSVGRRGLRHSIHSSGRRTSTIGAPGTGLSYSKTSTSRKKTKSNHSALTQQKENHVHENQAIVEQFNEHISFITNVHKQSPELIDWEKVKSLPSPYNPPEIGPHQSKAIQMYNDFTPNFLEKLLKTLGEKRKQQLEQEIKVAEQQDVNEYEEWLELNKLAKQVLQGDSRAYAKVIEEIDVFKDLNGDSFQFNVLHDQTVEVAFQVTAGEIVPNETLTLTKTGKLSRRAMTKTNYNKLVQDCVCSHAIMVARNILVLLPVQHVIVHVTDNVLNTATGYDEEIVVLSVLFDRNIVNKLNFENIDPSDAMENFRHNMNHLKTKGFRAVERMKE